MVAITAQEQRWDAAIAALLNCGTRTEAAKVAGVTTKTLRGYLDNPQFQKLYSAARARLMKDATAKLQSGVGVAVDTLLAIASDKKAQEHARVSAARAVLEFALKLTELTDINERLDALEFAVQEDSR